MSRCIGRQLDSNQRPAAYEAAALTGLSYAPAILPWSVCFRIALAFKASHRLATDDRPTTSPGEHVARDAPQNRGAILGVEPRQHPAPLGDHSVVVISHGGAHRRV